MQAREPRHGLDPRVWWCGRKGLRVAPIHESRKIVFYMRAGGSEFSDSAWLCPEQSSTHTCVDVNDNDGTLLPL